VEGEGDLDEGEVEERSEGLGLKFFKRFVKLIRLSIGKVSSQVFLIWFFQIAAMCLYGGLQIEIFKHYGTSVIVALITGTKPYTLATRNVDLALNKCGIIIALNSVIAVCQAFSCLAGAWLAVKVQRAVVRRFHAVYFSPGVVYHLNRIMKERGVDQRIVQDLSGLREALAWLFGNPFAYCNYRVGALPLFIVWVILLCHAFNCGWQLSLFMLGFMVLSFVWQIVACFATSRQVSTRQRWEGDLRLHLCRTLQNIETITFFGGQEGERAIADQLNLAVYGKRMSYYAWSNLTSLPTISMYYWLQTGIYVMAAVVAIWWAPGSSDVNPTNLFTTINFDIIWAKVVQLIIMCLGGLGMVVGFTHRVMGVVESAEAANVQVEAMQSKLHLADDVARFEGVSIAVPSRSNKTTSTMQINGLDLSLNKSLVIQGRGKSSVLRVLCGMWPHATGKVSRPKFGSGGIMFIPQGNYAVQGTLAAQVVYPKLVSEVTASAEELTSILNEVGLGDIVERWGLDRVVNWDVVLSGGECQRLGFARVLFHRPRIVVLDETTSALDLGTEDRCMKAVLARDIKMVSFAARPSVKSYHEESLQLSAAKSHTKEVAVNI
jgi:ATP-binding cassette subfamily D (ALD) protein 4